MIVGQEKKMSDIVMHWEDLKSKMVTVTACVIGFPNPDNMFVPKPLIFCIVVSESN